ncbi:hypothetical protein TorRG33x02_345790, partial [Trema orientale]
AKNRLEICLSMDGIMLEDFNEHIFQKEYDDRQVRFEKEKKKEESNMGTRKAL